MAIKIEKIESLTSTNELAKHASSDDWEVRDAVAQNPHTDEKTLKSLTEHHPEAVARNKNATTAILETLSGNSRHHVRAAVAAHLNTSKSAVEKLSKDLFSDVRLAAIASGNLSFGALVKISENDEWRPARVLASKMINGKSV